MSGYPRILGAALGDPYSPLTYSGVPFHCFLELGKLGILVGAVNSLIVRRRDYLSGRLDLRRSLREGRPCRNALWRFQPHGIAVLSKRFQSLERRLPEHDVVFQISGVGAMPLPRVALVAHVEISVRTAASLPYFAETYGFAHHSKQVLGKAMDGERRFLERCSIVFTNSTWCAAGLYEQGLHFSRVRVQAPGAGVEDPGPVQRRWDRCSILFIGVDWVRKGGPLLAKAFAQVRRAIPEATLTIVGCNPRVHDPGVRVVGFLNKDRGDELSTLHGLFREATVFCMPSHWESTGLVYMEAALYGLPIVMLRGQGREEIFPPSMAIHLEEATPAALAEHLVWLARHPDQMARMGENGRSHVLRNYTWPIVASRMLHHIRDCARS